jgi:hypothetical protein
MVNVKPVAQSAAKFVRNAQGAAGDYAQGATAAAGEYATAAAAAAPTFKAAISAANIEASYRNGVQRAGAAKYQRGVTTKGQARYGPGVSAAQQDYAAGVEPYTATLQSVQLPARQPRGSAANLQRVTIVAKALNDRRQQLAGAGSR